MSLGLAALIVWLVARLWEAKNWPPTPSFARTNGMGVGTRMLREDTNARLFSDRGGFLFERRYFFVATTLPPRRLPVAKARALIATRSHRPVPVHDNGQRRWWWWENAFYWENCGYTADDVVALVTERTRRRQRELDRAHALLAAERTPRQQRREHIPREVRGLVFERDGGRCTNCGANFDLQYDHIIPVAMGGASTIENLQLLCSPCNQDKGAALA